MCVCVYVNVHVCMRACVPLDMNCRCPQRLEAETVVTDPKGAGVTGSCEWVLGTELDSTARVIILALGC